MSDFTVEYYNKSMFDVKNDDLTGPQILEYVLNLIMQTLVLLIVGHICILCIITGTKRTGGHAMISSISFHFILMLGMSTFYPRNLVMYSLNYGDRVVVHEYCMLATLIIGIIGILHKYRLKEKGTHFKSEHASFGLTGTILIAINIALGYFTLHIGYDPSNIYKIMLTIAHVLLAAVAFIYCMISQYKSYDSVFYVRVFVKRRKHKILLCLSSTLLIIFVIETSSLHGKRFMDLLQRLTVKTDKKPTTPVPEPEP